MLRISEFLIFVFAAPCNLLDVGKTIGWSWSVVTPQGGGGNKDSGREGRGHPGAEILKQTRWPVTGVTRGDQPSPVHCALDRWR